MATVNDETVRARFESGNYIVEYLPHLIIMDYEGVFVNQEAPNPNIVDYIEKYKNLELVTNNTKKTPKLTANRYDDWSFSIEKLDRVYFPDRLKLESCLIDEEYREKRAECIESPRIALRDALKTMFVDFSCDMKYYLDNKNELEADLGRSLPSDLNLENESEVKRLEEELFYRNMCQILGPANETDQQEGREEKSFMIKDFKILSYDGNDMKAVGQRDDYYLIFSLAQ